MLEFQLFVGAFGTLVTVVPAVGARSVVASTVTASIFYVIVASAGAPVVAPADSSVPAEALFGSVLLVFLLLKGCCDFFS